MEEILINILNYSLLSEKNKYYKNVCNNRYKRQLLSWWFTSIDSFIKNISYQFIFILYNMNKRS